MEKGGSFVIATDPVSSPVTVRHILRLVGTGFYDQQRIHRVEHWVTQWGAPASKDKPLDSDEVGDGGSGADILFEESPVQYLRGVVGIASRGKKKGGDSQLFILKKDAVRLNGNYAVVGLVIKGMDVVDRIGYGDRIRRIQVLK
jgi:cyclophilin family peptidyl-prolyl cis-trans isomerase